MDADSNMIENAILNIAINARDAMPNGGKLAFATTMATLTQDTLPSDSEDLLPGPYIIVKISDTGTGMDKETQKRIFEPFFTTKEPGKGTGLGLAAVYGCVRQHKGHVAVESEKGFGTTFSLYFPESAAGPYAEAAVDSVCVKGCGSVLGVDDDKAMCEVLAEILKNLGYAPTVFLDPLEALDYFGENHRVIDAVVLDLVMPKMSGLDLFRALKQLDPGLKVIVASGYSGGDQEKLIMQEGAKEFVQKPYRISEMSKVLARVIGASK